MKRIFTLLAAVLTLTVATTMPAFASDYDALAEDLAAIGMFRGTANGFELDRAPTRAEAAIMLVRLYGAEEEAQEAYKSGELTMPFTDVGTTAAPYVAYLYTHGITNGTTATSFGTGTCSAQNYAAFLLRALGYQDNVDFSYSNVLSFAQQKGIYDPQLFSGDFLRDDLVAVTYRALGTDLKDGSGYLLERLIDSGAVDAKAAAPLVEKIEANRDTVTQQNQLWTRVVNGKEVSYNCNVKNTNYQTYPAWRPTWNAEGWGLVKLNQSQRDSSWASWQYQYGNGTLTFRCSYPTDASFGTFMQTEEAANSYQKTAIQGYQADFYTDGSDYLLVWENKDGILFYLEGTRVDASVMTQVAESVQPYTGETLRYTLNWKPSGYTLFEEIAMGNAVQQVWTNNGKSLVVMYASDPVALPDSVYRVIDVRGVQAYFWEATETSEEDDGKQANGGAASSATIPGVQSKEYSTLAWTDPETGINYRLQGKESQDTLIRIAENIK